MKRRIFLKLAGPLQLECTYLASLQLKEQRTCEDAFSAKHSKGGTRQQYSFIIIHHYQIVLESSVIRVIFTF
jgi:hypothetical protein